MRNIYDNSEFFAAYAEMGRSKDGLKAAGEWHQLQPLFPKLQGKKVLDLGCGYGWHCKYAAQMGATEILGIDSSQKMIAKAVADNSDDKIKYKVCGVEEYIYPENTYDLVVSNLVLHYIENCNGVQREHNKKLNNGLPILHKVPPKRDYGRYFCIMAEKGGTSHGGLTEKLSLFFHAKKQEVNAYGR